MSPDQIAIAPRSPAEQFRVVLLIFCALIVYFPAVNAGFIWDDDLLLTANPQMLSVRGLVDIWLGKNCCDYTPITLTMFWVQHALWGNTPTGYHVVNILLHALASVLLFKNLSILRIRGAWLAALLFAIHPVNVASVAWISELKNTLSAMFFFASILTFLISQKRSNATFYAASILLFVFAGLSKGAVVMLPMILCGCVLWMNRRITRLDLLRIFPFAFVAIAIAALTIVYQLRAPDYQLFAFDPASRFARAGTVVWLYLLEIFWPIKLSPMFAQWQPEIRSALTYLPALLLAAGMAMVYWKRKTWGRAPLFGFGYFTLMLLPVLGFVWMALQQEISSGDWWQYLAAPGIFAAVAAGFYGILDRFRKPRPVFIALLCMGLSMLFIQTWRRTAIYESMETYCRAVLAEEPHIWTLQTNFGVMLARRGEFEQAIRHYHVALRDNPRYMPAHNDLGNSLRALGDLSHAESEFRAASRLSPTNPIVLSNLADTRLQRKIQEAHGQSSPRE